MNWEEESFEFPGWPLKNNPHGEEFNKDARRRMISGSETLLPTIYKYKNKLGNNILEIGPFFNPLITKKNFPEKTICYWENDLHVLNWITELNKENDNVRPIFCDLNTIEGDSQLTLKHETDLFFKDTNNKDKLFDVVMVSQVFNYVDYKLLLILLRNFIKKGGYVFINNVVDYGLPKFFSAKRPKSIPLTLKTIEETGYKIVEKQIIESPFPKAQKEDRLILVVKKE